MKIRTMTKDRGSHRLRHQGRSKKVEEGYGSMDNAQGIM